VHHFRAARVGVKDMAAILKIISNQQINVPVAIEIGLDGRIREPSFAAGGQLGRLKGVSVEPARYVLAQVNDRVRPQK